MPLRWQSRIGYRDSLLRQCVGRDRSGRVVLGSSADAAVVACLMGGMVRN